MTRPLSIVVVGNSVSVMTHPPRSARAEGTFGEVLIDLMADGGQPATLHLHGRWFGLATEAVRDYVDRVMRHSPDVLVLQFGLNESQPWLVPVGLLRHLLRDHHATRPAALWYRRRVAAPLWLAVRAYRRRAARLVGTRTWQVGPRRFRAALTQIISMTRNQFHPLVLVLDMPAPGERLNHFLPGQSARHAIFQSVLGDVVAGFDDEVRLVSVSSLVAGRPDLTQDDIHLTAEGHRLVAEMLHAEVAQWMAAQPVADDQPAGS